MIKCCRDCVPPKRHIGCHGYCEDYIEEKVINDKLRSEKQQMNDLLGDIYKLNHTVRQRKGNGVIKSPKK